MYSAGQLGSMRLISAKDYCKGDCISQFKAKQLFDRPNAHSLQLGPDKHIELQPFILQFTNHSCSPSAYFDTDKMELTALRDIKIHQEITFFYPSTQWQMGQPFECKCGKTECLGLIQGAKSLENSLLTNFKLSQHIRRLKQQQSKETK